MRDRAQVPSSALWTSDTPPDKDPKTAVLNDLGGVIARRLVHHASYFLGSSFLRPVGSQILTLTTHTAPFTESETKEAQTAARALGVQLHVLTANTEAQVESVFANSALAHSSSRAMLF
jgi:hypothetical protein